MQSPSRMTTSDARRGFLLVLATLLLGPQSGTFGTQSSAESGGKQASGAWFTDIANRFDFSYRTNNDFTGRKYFPQPMCGGVAIFDYDNDGKMDIFFTNGTKLPELTKTNRLGLESDRRLAALPAQFLVLGLAGNPWATCPEPAAAFGLLRRGRNPS